MFYKSILSIVPFLAVYYACSCLQSTQEEVYERSDIVAHVLITSKNVSSDSIYYEIHYNETFKPQAPKNPHVIVPIPLPNRIVTASSSAACGVENLEIGREYLVAGRRQANLLAINSCSGFPSSNNDQSEGDLEWSSVDKGLLGKLQSGFQ